MQGGRRGEARRGDGLWANKVSLNVVPSIGRHEYALERRGGGGGGGGCRGTSASSAGEDHGVGRTHQNEHERQREQEERRGVRRDFRLAMAVWFRDGATSFGESRHSGVAGGIRSEWWRLAEFGDGGRRRRGPWWFVAPLAARSPTWPSAAWWREPCLSGASRSGRQAGACLS